MATCNATSDSEDAGGGSARTRQKAQREESLLEIAEDEEVEAAARLASVTMRLPEDEAGKSAASPWCCDRRRRRCTRTS